MARAVDPKIKAQALAELIAGAPLKTTARKYGIARQTLQNWKDAAGLDTVFTPSVRARIWDEVDRYILEALQAMRAQLAISQDEAWIKSHDPAGLAALHNVIGEKVGRLVEAEAATAAEAAEPIDIRSRR